MSRNRSEPVSFPFFRLRSCQVVDGGGGGGSPSGDYRESALKIKLSEKVKKIADRAKNRNGKKTKTKNGVKKRETKTETR